MKWIELHHGHWDQEHRPTCGIPIMIQTDSIIAVHPYSSGVDKGITIIQTTDDRDFHVYESYNVVREMIFREDN